MDDVRKKVLLDVFLGYPTLIPGSIGASLVLLGIAISSGLVASLGGLGILAALGTLATKFLFNLEGITEKVYNIAQEAEKQKEQNALDKLHKRLVLDRDPQTQVMLRDLRRLHGDFFNKLDEGQIKAANRDIPETIESLFRACIKRLERSYDLYERSQALRGDGRRQLEQERSEIVGRVRQSVEDLSSAIAQFTRLADIGDDTELADIRNELAHSMSAATAAETEVSRIGRPDYDESEFE